MTDTAKPTLGKGCTVKLWDRASFRYFVSDEAVDVYHETGLTPRQLLERVRELEAEKQDMLSVLQNIGLYGCGMLSQPAAMNAPEESWLRMRIQEMEFVAREAFFKYRGQEAALAKHGEVK